MCESIRIPLPVHDHVIHYQARHAGGQISGSLQTMLDPSDPRDLEAIHEILRAQGVTDDAEVDLGLI